MFDVCVIGHITRDIIIRNQKRRRWKQRPQKRRYRKLRYRKLRRWKRKMPGGVAYYFPITLKNLGSKVALITKAAKEDKERFEHLKDLKGIQIFFGESETTTVFENIYQENLDYRIQNVKSVAEPFSAEDIPDISSHFYHLGPLTKEDIPLEILKLLFRKAKLSEAKLSLDIQGFLRTNYKGKIKNVDWEEKEEGLAYVNILKTDETEVKILSGEANIKRAARKLSKKYDNIDEIIVTRGSLGSLIFSEGEFCSIDAFSVRKIVDATGCGDTYLAAYIHKRRKSSSVKERGIFAAATATLKLEEFGPFRGTEEDVQNFLEKHRSVSRKNF